MTAVIAFCRQVRSRSNEHRHAMHLLSGAGLAGQMVAILRQELDSMARVIYLVAQPIGRRNSLIESSVNGERWSQPKSKGPVTDREMIDLSQKLQGWTRSVYKFGCAFIHLSSVHDYNDRDPFGLLPTDEQQAIIQHCRFYHGGPITSEPSFLDFVPYIPLIFEKITDNLRRYVEKLENGVESDAEEIW